MKLSMMLMVMMLGLKTMNALRLDDCNVPLGMQSSKISDAQLSASSSFDLVSVGPQNARIRTEKAAGAWCPSEPITKETYEFLQIDLRRIHLIRAVEIQGRYGNGSGREFATHFMVDYWHSGTVWIRYSNSAGHTVDRSVIEGLSVQLMNGNVDTNSSVYSQLSPPLLATRLRVVPFSAYPRTVCLRVELYGCPYKEGVLSYTLSSPGEQESNDLAVLSIDGEPSRGLGTLTDGIIAEDDPDTEQGRKYWLGWSHLETERVFDEFTLHGWNDGKREETLRMEVSLSNDGHHYRIISLTSKSSLTSTSSSPSNESSSSLSNGMFSTRRGLNGHSGRFIQLTLLFDSDWLYLTEIDFVSEPKMAVILVTDRDQISPSSLPNWTLLTAGSFLISVLFLLFSCLLIIRCRRRHIDTEKQRRRVSLITNDNHHQHYPFTQKLTIMEKKNSTLHIKERPFNSYSSSTGNSNNGNGNGTLSTNDSLYLPSLLDFHFPPPPPLEQEDVIYAQPFTPSPIVQSCQTVPRRMMILSPSSSSSPIKSVREEKLHYPLCFRLTSPYSSSITRKATGLQLSTGQRTGQRSENMKEKEKKMEKIAPDLIELGALLGQGKCMEIVSCRVQGMPGRFALKRLKKNNSTIGNSRSTMGNAHSTMGNARSRRELLQHELETMSKCCHEHIIKVIGVVERGEEHGFDLLLEWMEELDCRSWIRNNGSSLTSHLLFRTVADIANGMVYLSRMGLIHGHLSPANCLVSANGRVKIASIRGPGHHAQLRYSAPETILMNVWTSGSDVWSFGVTGWEILDRCRKSPFADLSNAELLRNAQLMLAGEEKNVIRLPRPIECSPEVYEMLMECWRCTNQPSFPEIHVCLLSRLMIQ